MTQLVMAVVVPLTWVAAIFSSGADDVAGAATLVLPAIILSQELTVLIVKGRISRMQAALVRLTVIGVALLVGYLLNRLLS